MRKRLPACVLALTALVLLSPSPLRAQGGGNIDWEELWVVMQPSSNTHPIYGWMAGQRQYTGLAYDKVRDNLYIVNPGLCSVASITIGCPKIHIWDPLTGLPKMSEGRAANGQYGLTPGQGGQLPVPSDTIAGILTPTWPNNWYTSFSQGQFPIYKIDVDDEVPPRIFATNLVAPIYGICFPGPPPNCRPEYLAQGPLRVWRWETPKSTPTLSYITLNPQSGYLTPGTLGTPDIAYSELPWTRWGDALDVVGKRGVYDFGNGLEVVDSVRIFTSGGPFDGQTETNRFVGVILTDRRPNRLATNFGRQLDYRLGILMESSLEGVASHGLAATGPESFAQVWMDANARVTLLNNQYQTSAPFPQNMLMTFNHALSDDPISGTGPSGPITFFRIAENGNSFLACADGMPTTPGDPTSVNYNTRARVMNVSVLGQERREPGFGDTPYLGQRILTNNSGINNYIADIDVKLEPDYDSGKGYYVTLFVLMSNNGIAAYRSRKPLVPVELSTFKAVLNDGVVDLTWNVTQEVNNYGFQVERSFNLGRTWETIGFVRGRGTDSRPAEYRYQDAVTEVHRDVGHVQYRLRQVDTDGKTQISPVVDVYLSGAPVSIALSQNYPNPFNP
ncbi:MAG: hypothetical protein QHI48_10380, partial [Bacteroidota bacterium]|nr:hypothetical protein [Bacteroidota bacterium]